ncbi:hypothetical protein BCR35DRAFT_307011 [Leucosporidium creatinivorum]|uniref:Uncharacterized protein n=1 Tax=Leucosporidium creatinivorum TaxID=106004 RepID=A0A1Y2EPR7_9BASI|nr:hypothetical protein BCR35DRAFT_307011 [Leucosporidium creatinivorum]
MSSGGYFQHTSAPSSRASSLHAPPSHLTSSELSPASSRRDPFIDPRLSLDSYSTGGDPFRSDVSHDSRSRDSSHSRERPALPSRPSEVQRQLASALEEELDVEDLGSRTPMAEVPPKPARRSASSSSSGGKKEKDKDSFWAQFQSGKGWFSPVVEPPPKLTREEREAAEKARIEKLRDEGKGTRRPNLLKRLSSGVEMGNWRPGNASPSKSGRARGDSITEGTTA